MARKKLTKKEFKEKYEDHIAESLAEGCVEFLWDFLQQGCSHKDGKIGSNIIGSMVSDYFNNLSEKEQLALVQEIIAAM